MVKFLKLLTVQEQAGFQMILGKLDGDHIEYLKHSKIRCTLLDSNHSKRWIACQLINSNP